MGSGLVKLVILIDSEMRGSGFTYETSWSYSVIEHSLNSSSMVYLSIVCLVQGLMDIGRKGELLKSLVSGSILSYDSLLFLILFLLLTSRSNANYSTFDDCSRGGTGSDTLSVCASESLVLVLVVCVELSSVSIEVWQQPFLVSI